MGVYPFVLNLKSPNRFVTGVIRQLDIDESEIDLFVVYDLIINGGGLICSHCGKRIRIEELFEQKIVVGNEEGYITHVDCLLEVFRYATIAMIRRTRIVISAKRTV